MGAAVLGLSNLVNRIARCNLFESKVIIFFEAWVRRAQALRWVAILGKRGVAKYKKAPKMLLTSPHSLSTYPLSPSNL